MTGQGGMTSKLKRGGIQATYQEEFFFYSEDNQMLAQAACCGCSIPGDL